MSVLSNDESIKLSGLRKGEGQAAEHTAAEDPVGDLWEVHTALSGWAGVLSEVHSLEHSLPVAIIRVKRQYTRLSLQNDECDTNRVRLRRILWGVSSGREVWRLATLRIIARCVTSWSRVSWRRSGRRHGSGYGGSVDICQILSSGSSASHAPDDAKYDQDGSHCWMVEHTSRLTVPVALTCGNRDCNSDTRR